MNLRSLWSGGLGPVGDKPTSDALEYITKRINLIWRRQHTEEGNHQFTGTTVPFDPSTFGSTTAGQTWTLVQANQITYRFVNIGGWVYVTGVFSGTVAGVAGNTLTIRLPLGIRGPATAVASGGWAFDAGVGQALFVGLDGVVDQIQVIKTNLANWTNGGVQARFMIFWEMRPNA